MNIEIIRDMSLVFAAIILANIVFNNFEKHLPLWRRVLKHGIFFLFLLFIRIFFGGSCLLILLIRLVLP